MIKGIAEIINFFLCSKFISVILPYFLLKRINRIAEIIGEL